MDHPITTAPSVGAENLFRVEINVSNGMLRIHAERRQETERADVAPLRPYASGRATITTRTSTIGSTLSIRIFGGSMP